MYTIKTIINEGQENEIVFQSSVNPVQEKVTQSEVQFTLQSHFENVISNQLNEELFVAAGSAQEEPKLEEVSAFNVTGGETPVITPTEETPVVETVTTDVSNTDTVIVNNSVESTPETPAVEVSVEIQA